MNLKRVRSLMVCVLPLSLPLFAACSAPVDSSADPGEGKVGVSAQAIISAGTAAVAGGDWGSLALRADGTVWAWGYNSNGQLGGGSGVQVGVDQHAPVQVNLPPGLTVTAVAAGETNYSFALMSDRTVWAWGSNIWSQLGSEVMPGADQPTPVQVSGLSNVTAVVASNIHPIALTLDQTVWTWGFNGEGQLGNGHSFGGNTTTPARVQQDDGTVANLSAVIAVAGGAGHGLALKQDRTVWAWGNNAHGQLGNNSTDNEYSAHPVLMPALPPGVTVTAVAAGSHSSFALASDGTVWAWGDNGLGQLGHGTNPQELTPVQVNLPSSVIVTALASSYDSVLALTSAQTVWAWGHDSHGQLGDGTTGGSTNTRSTPVLVLVAQVGGGLTALTGVTSVATGDRHSLAVTSDGAIWTWGLDNHGQLGDGATTDRHTAAVLCATAPPAQDACHAAPICVLPGVWYTPPAPVLGQPCNTGLLGVCATGTTTCTTGTIVCNQDVLPSAEACDGLDNDCNGQVDDGLGTITCGVGTCAGTVPACTGGVPGICAPQPDGWPCTDSDACTSSDHCTSGVCGGTAYTCPVTSCEASSTCDGNGGCTVVDDGPGVSCGDGLVCDGRGSCVTDCFIGGSLYAADSRNPASTCQVCTPGTSINQWSSEPDGARCPTGVCMGVVCEPVWMCEKDCSTSETNCAATAGTTVSNCEAHCLDQGCIDPCEDAYTASLTQCENDEKDCKGVCTGP